MPDWRITSGDPEVHPGWTALLGDCDQAHAESVVAQLEAEIQAPSDLQLTQLPVVPVAPAPVPWWRRLIRRA